MAWVPRTFARLLRTRYAFFTTLTFALHSSVTFFANCAAPALTMRCSFSQPW